MASNNIANCQRPSKRCCSHCSSVHPIISTRKSRSNRAPHCRYNRPHSPTSSNYGHPITSTAMETQSNRCLSPYPATSSTTPPHQVSHFTAINPLSNVETSSITDTTTNGDTSFHTVLQIITIQGSNPLHIKVDPGTSCTTIPLSHFHKIFSKYFTKTGVLKKTGFKPTACNWSSHDGTLQNLLGYIMLDIQHKTLPQILPCKCFMLEDVTSPDILLCYPASSRLCIIEFKVPNNKTPVFPLAVLDTVTSRPKIVTFSTHLDNTTL